MTDYIDVRRITDGVRRRKKLQEIKQDLRRKMHEPIAGTGKWLKSVIQGYNQYFAVPGNIAVRKNVRTQVARLARVESALMVSRAVSTQPKAAYLGKAGSSVRLQASNTEC